MDDDTLVTPDPGQEPEPANEPEPTPGSTPEPTPEPTLEPPPLTADDIISKAGEQAFQRMASWQGRRDKDLLDSVGQMIDSKMTSSQSTDEPITMLDDPDTWVEGKFKEAIPRMMDAELQRRGSQQQQYTSEIIQHAGRLMDADPLFSDKDLGNEVIAEVQKIFGTVNQNVSPDIGAQLLVSNAYSNVMRKRNVKSNPLAGNTGAAGVGGVTAPVTNKPNVKPVKLTALAQKLAERGGYTDEDLARVFGEE